MDSIRSGCKNVYNADEIGSVIQRSMDMHYTENVNIILTTVSLPKLK